MNKTIICYFSASGITKNVALKISSIINGDLFEIKPLEEYSNEDLNWNNPNSKSSIEMNDSSVRPRMKEQLTNIDNYNTVIIGYPIWWDLAPRIINTFIESINLENKKVYIFATSGGSSIEGSLNNLRKTYPNINFVNGKRLSTNIDSNEISFWLNS